MRYTTVIDVTEIADVWKNPNICRLYFYMALKCGYQDDDRDILKISLRTLAEQASLTLSATRHALKVLERQQLVTQEKDAFRVTKFVLSKKPTSRTQKNTTTTTDELSELRRQQEFEIERKTREKGELLHTLTADECREIIERLNEKHRSIAIRGVVFRPSVPEIENIQKWIEFKEKKKQ